MSLRSLPKHASAPEADVWCRPARDPDYGHIHVEACSGGMPVALADAPRLRLGYRVSRYVDFTATLPIDAARIDNVVVSHRLTDD